MCTAQKKYQKNTSRLSIEKRDGVERFECLHVYLEALYVYVYTPVFVFFSSSDTSLRACTFIRNSRGGGHNSTVGVTLPEVWGRSLRCVVRDKPLKVFGLGH